MCDFYAPAPLTLSLLLYPKTNNTFFFLEKKKQKYFNNKKINFSSAPVNKSHVLNYTAIRLSKRVIPKKKKIHTNVMKYEQRRRSDDIPEPSEHLLY